MISTTIARKPAFLQSSDFYVYEYSLVLINPEDQNIQGATAVLKQPATSHDWDCWLRGWRSAGYQLQSQPQLNSRHLNSTAIALNYGDRLSLPFLINLYLFR